MSTGKLKVKRQRVPLKYRVDIFWSAEDDAYVAKVPELPGCSTHGGSYVDAAMHVEEAIDLYLESLSAKGVPAPTPFAERNFSGKLPLRIDPFLHRDLALEAEREHTSINKLIEKKLSSAS